ncbi:MAG: hypothetical protein AAF357_14795, partial [Verrucomicrobiota bacterium]
MKTTLLTLAFFVAALMPAVAQDINPKPGTVFWESLYDPPYAEPTEIPAGDPLRKELFDLLRPKLEPIAKKPILFSGSLQAFKNWALFQGESQDKEGNPIAYPDMGNSDTVGLWLRTADGWKLVSYEG